MTPQLPDTACRWPSMSFVPLSPSQPQQQQESRSEIPRKDESSQPPPTPYLASIWEKNKVIIIAGLCLSLLLGISIGVGVGVGVNKQAQRDSSNKVNIFSQTTPLPISVLVVLPPYGTNGLASKQQAAAQSTTIMAAFTAVG